MFTAETKVRVRYAETDQMGFVHHANYALYFEMARIEAIEKVGITYKEFEKSGTAMPVVHMGIDYRRPAFFDEVLTIKTCIAELPSTKLIFEYEVYNHNNELLTEAKTILVFLNIETRRPTRCPEQLLNGLMPYFTRETQVT